MYSQVTKIFLISIVLSGFLFAQPDGELPKSTDYDALFEERRKPVSVPKFSSSPTIDGNLDDAAWKQAAQFKDFVQTEPGERLPPSRETIAYMGYDEKHLYIAFMCFDEPEQIRATVAKRDRVGGEDYVGIFLDTFDAERRAYLFQFNPYGIQGDGIKSAGDFRTDLSVDIVMESKGMLLPNGWSVEVKIPFKSLRYQAGKGKSWGFDLFRRIDHLNREVVGWMPMVRGVSELQQLGKITGLDEIKAERTLEITPSVTISENGERIEDAGVPGGSRFVNRPIENDIGVSIKYQLTPNITLDAAINPDFAEVEADAPVVRANQRFPIFFPEKRTFFLEGIDIFRSRLQVVNTRNIANPDVALKLTGKVGKNTFGILGAVDDFPESDDFPDGVKAYAGVLRLRRDIGANNNVGLFATQYHRGSDRHNSLIGFDGSFQKDSRTVFDFEAVASYSRRFFYNPDIDDSEYRGGTGIAYRAQYDYTGRNRGWSITASGRSRDYRADLGFTRRTNTHGANFGFRLGTEPKPTNTLIGIVTRTFSGINFDESGRLQNARVNSRVRFDFQNQLEIDFSGGVSRENLYEDEFGARRNQNQQGAFFGEDERGSTLLFGEVGIEKSFGKLFGFEAEVGFTKNALDLDFGASERYPRVSPAAFLGDDRLDPGKGFLLRYELGLRLQPSDPLSIRFSYDRRRLKRDDTGLTAFDSNIFSLRSTYQFTRFIFARTRFDYETVDGSLNSQHLFGWNPSPGTAFYLGYNDNSGYRTFNEFNNQFDPGFRRYGRRFFIRMSYLFRKSF